MVCGRRGSFNQGAVSGVWEERILQSRGSKWCVGGEPRFPSGWRGRKGGGEKSLVT